MRKVNLFIACSLDGYIAGPKGEIDWLFSDGDYGYAKFYKSVDAIIMGRKTYELSLGFDKWPHPGKKTYVLSRRKSNKADTRVEFASNGVELTKKLLKEKGKLIWLVGGGQAIKDLLNANLIDEYVISIHPVILGSGIPLFTGIKKQHGLKLHGVEKFNSGLVQLKYMAKEK